jgi:hypothetical protein
MKHRPIVHAILALAALSPSASRAQAGTNYNAAQQAQQTAVAAGMAASAALQFVLTGGVPSELGPLPGDALAGTSPDCPSPLPILLDHESKFGTQNKEKIRFDPNYRAKLIKNGYLCEKVEPRLEMTIVLGVIIQEVHNAGNNSGPWTPENKQKWERDGHLVNKRFMEAIKEVPELVPDPDSRKKLCKRIKDFCALIKSLGGTW